MSGQEKLLDWCAEYEKRCKRNSLIKTFLQSALLGCLGGTITYVIYMSKDSDK